MSVPLPAEGRDRELVRVRLSSIPQKLRASMAGAIVERGRLDGDQAIAFLLAATARRQDPTLLVPRWKADLVLREQRLPPGETLKVWTW